LIPEDTLTQMNHLNKFHSNIHLGTSFTQS